MPHTACKVHIGQTMDSFFQGEGVWSADHYFERYGFKVGTRRGRRLEPWIRWNISIALQTDERKVTAK